MVAYKNLHSPESEKKLHEYKHRSSLTGMQNDHPNECHMIPDRFYNTDKNLDSLVHVQPDNEISQATKAGSTSLYHSDSQTTEVLRQRVRYHNIDAKGVQEYDFLQPVWFEKILQKIEENKAKEKKPSGKGVSYISVN